MGAQGGAASRPHSTPRLGEAAAIEVRTFRLIPRSEIPISDPFALAAAVERAVADGRAWHGDYPGDGHDGGNGLRARPHPGARRAGGGDGRDARTTDAGETLRRACDFKGSETDLPDRGLISAGWLDDLEARLLPTLLPMAGADRRPSAKPPPPGSTRSPPVERHAFQCAGALAVVRYLCNS